MPGTAGNEICRDEHEHHHDQQKKMSQTSGSGEAATRKRLASMNDPDWWRRAAI